MSTALDLSQFAGDESYYVAWLKYTQQDGRPSRISVCDSDAPGAFKVYREHTLLALAREQAAQIERMREACETAQAFVAGELEYAITNSGKALGEVLRAALAQTEGAK